MSQVNILFVGDVVGKPGRWAVYHLLPRLKSQFRADCTIVNVENAAQGFGCTRAMGEAFLRWGADLMTSGNHIWDRLETQHYLNEEPRLLRPANYPVGNAGVGSGTFINEQGVTFGVLNIQGRVFMPPIDCPFKVAMELVAELRKQTAFLCDSGMTGPYDSIIGMRQEGALKRFLTAMPEKFTVAEGDVRLAAVLVAADAETGRAEKIQRFMISMDADATPSLSQFKD
jgi:hypothetical protein